ncbi:MAG: T9SS type A sorting domain-containing protein, partial [Bacteroidia bacterium]|nr:T9SS type A sorting domain-containing protein [Bacteroidia bacterium]
STVINGINCEANGYTDSTASNYININLNAANTYTLLINTTTDGTYGNAAMGAWIDYNQNAIFDSQEFISLGHGTASTYSTPFTVPLVTPSGTVRMRLKLDNNNAGSWTTLDPCNNNNGSSYGQIIDFKVNITAAPACSAAPNLGNAVSSLGSVCSFDEYTLNLTGNDQVSGLSYQWQSSPNGSTWTNLGSAQNTILYTANSQTATTHFRCVATCTNGGAIGTSNPVIVNQNLPTACYCIPELSNCSTAYFSNVIIETLNDNPTCNSGVNGYLDNTVAVPSISVSANQSYTISTTTSSQGPPTYTGVWVDYDHNGIFAPNEYSYIGFSNDATALTGTINIPYTAIGGDTRMRLKMDATYGSFSGIDPCYTNDYDGQTIDYLLNITPVTPCTGMPNAGDAISSYTSSCENRPFTLDLVNNDVVSNIWYQWQQSTDGTNWANIGTSQSSIPYTVSSQSITTYYRCELTCASSSSISTSSTFTMTQKPTTECYCIPPPSNCNNSDVINTVVFSNLTNTSTCSTDGYEDYTLNGSIITPTVNANQSYPINVTVGREYYEYVTVWVDFDKNGNFEADEYTNIGAPAGSGNFTATGSILIPSNATLGTTRMRIRTNYNSPFYDYEACEGSNGNEELRGPSQGSGETEDYSITILPPDCSTINFPPSVSLSGVLDICPGGSTTLDIATSIPLATGITYQWKAFDGSSYVDEGSATPSSSIIVTPGSNTLYYCEIFCNATSTRISDTVTVKLNPVTTALTFTNASCSGLCDGSIQLNATSSGGLLTYSWSPSLPNADQVITLCAGTYSVIVSNTVGCTATETVSITEPTPLTASLTTTDVTCNGLNNGSISVVANGGTPAYTYSWAPTFGNSSTINGLSAGTYTCMIYDINGCFINEYATVNEPGAITATIAGFSSTICEQLNDTLKSTIVGGIAPYTYSWNQLPGSIVSTDPIYSYSTSVGTFSYNLTITDNTGCSANSNTLVITVNPSSNISGLVTTNTTTPVAGRVVLFQYLPFYTKFDSVAGQNIDPSGNYNFVSFKAGIYIVKAIPSAGNLQIAYGDSAVNWKTAKQILHGCSTNDVQNIEVKALSSFTTTGSGTLSGKITKALGFDQRPGSSFKPSAPGDPIGGIVVKGGKNPGGQMFVQTVTEPVGGTYTLTGLPINEAGESYFILVDIPGLDTNNTYHRIIDITNNEYNNLDFTVDSAKINPVNEPFVSVSVNDISAKLNQIKVFPNPATNKVIIQYNLAINSAVKIELFDILGKSVKTILPLTNQINTNYSYTVLLDDLTSGMYFMKLNINNSESTIKLIINN